MFPLVGFKSTSVYYERHERIAGESHYPLSKMLALAFDGITSLSVKPIRIIVALGILISLISFIGVIWSVSVRLMGHSVDGWASTISTICFIGGIQLLCIGVIGEYIGKILHGSKETSPLYYQRKKPALYMRKKTKFSGGKETKMIEFVKKVQNQHIFVRIVQSSVFWIYADPFYHHD